MFLPVSPVSLSNLVDDVCDVPTPAEYKTETLVTAHKGPLSALNRLTCPLSLLVLPLSTHPFYPLLPLSSSSPLLLDDVHVMFMWCLGPLRPQVVLRVLRPY